MKTLLENVCSDSKVQDLILTNENLVNQLIDNSIYEAVIWNTKLINNNIYSFIEKENILATYENIMEFSKNDMFHLFEAFSTILSDNYLSENVKIQCLNYVLEVDSAGEGVLDKFKRVSTRGPDDEGLISKAVRQFKGEDSPEHLKKLELKRQKLAEQKPAGLSDKAIDASKSAWKSTKDEVSPNLDKAGKWIESTDVGKKISDATGLQGAHLGAGAAAAALGAAALGAYGYNKYKKAKAVKEAMKEKK